MNWHRHYFKSYAAALEAAEQSQGGIIGQDERGWFVQMREQAPLREVEA